MGTELEIKAPALPGEDLDPDVVLAALAGHVPLRSEVRTVFLDARYHDDPEGRLRSAGWTLRARREDDATVATTKGRGQLVAGVRQRVEINAPLAALPEPGDPLPEPIAAAFAAARLPITTWPPQAYRSVVKRTVAEVELPGAVAELAIDHGRVEADGKRSPVRELELELVEGDPGALVDAAVMLAASLGLRPGGWAKAARGMALLGRLRDPVLPPSPTLMERWEQLVDVEDRLRHGEGDWFQTRRQAVTDLIWAGAPEELGVGLHDPDATRARIDTEAHASLLWGIFVAAVRAGRQGAADAAER